MRDVHRQHCRSNIVKRETHNGVLKIDDVISELPGSRIAIKRTFDRVQGLRKTRRAWKPP